VGERDEDLYRIIFGGGQVMPAFGNSLSEEGVWKLVSYIRHLSKPAAEKPTGNPIAGADLFWTKGNCGACHRIGTKGASIGPDLTKVGARHNVQYLRTAMTDPDADLANGFATITVITNKEVAGRSARL
jgi:mono/diheme cytochrome c family protein